MRVAQTVKRDLNEQVTVEVSLKELVLLHKAVGTKTTHDITEVLNRYGFKELAEEIEEEDLMYKVYNEIGEVLKGLGVSI